MESRKGNDGAESLRGGDSEAPAQRGPTEMHAAAHGASSGVDLSRTSSASSTSSWNMCDETDSPKDERGAADGSSVGIASRAHESGAPRVREGKRSVTFDFNASRVVATGGSGRQDIAMSLSDLTSDTNEKTAAATGYNNKTWRSASSTNSSVSFSATARPATSPNDRAAVDGSGFSWSFPTFSFATSSDANQSSAGTPASSSSRVATNSNDKIEDPSSESARSVLSPSKNTSAPSEPMPGLSSERATASARMMEESSLESSRASLEAIASIFKMTEKSEAREDSKYGTVSEAPLLEDSQSKASDETPISTSQAASVFENLTANGTSLSTQQPPSPGLFIKKIFWSTVLTSVAGETAKNLPCMSSASVDALFVQAERSPLGPVYKAKMNSDTPVQVTIVNMLPGKKAFEQIERELLQIRDLPVHPNVTSVYGHCHLPCGKQVALVSESVRGLSDLDSLLSKSVIQRLIQNKHQIILQIIRAVEFLHSHSVSHRCLSSQSILVDRDGSIKVTNYGVPTLKNATMYAGNTGTFVGFSGPYASPELLRGELSRNDVEGWKKSDIYSLCVLVMELLMEEKAWVGELPAYYTKAVMQRGERPFSTADIRVGGRTNERLELAISSAWNQDPAKRPTATQLRQALEDVFLLKPIESTDSRTRPKPADNSPTTSDTSLSESFVFPLPRDRPSPVVFSDDACQDTVNLSQDAKGNDEADDKSLEEYRADHDREHKSLSSSLSPPLGSTDEAASKRFSTNGTEELGTAIETAKETCDRQKSRTPFVISFTGLHAPNAKQRPAFINGVGSVIVRLVDELSSRQFEDHFDKELARLRELSTHPRIARHYGKVFLAVEGRVGLITEQPAFSESVYQRLYHPGASVLSEKTKFSIILQVADGLAFLHQNDVVHGRLSVMNVLSCPRLFGELEVKLDNYGLPSLTIGEDNHLSPFNAPPEVLNGDLHKNDHKGWKKCDMYAFAVFIMELLMEDRPWFGELPIYVAHAVTKLKQRPYDVEDLRVFGEPCPALGELVTRAWDQNPAMRPSAAEMHSRLYEIFQSRLQ